MTDELRIKKLELEVLKAFAKKGKEMRSKLSPKELEKSDKKIAKWWREHTHD